MRFVVAALLLLTFQQFWWRTPSPDDSSSSVGAASAPSSGDSLPPAVELLLGDRNCTAEAVALIGRVVDASPTWGEGVRLTVAVETADDAAADGLVSVSLRQTSRTWRSGDRLALRSRLRRITGFGNFGELDWAAYNARRGIFVGGYAWRDDDVKVLERGDGVVDRLRRRFSEACARVGGPGAEILEALVIGDRTGIDRATSVAVRDAGLAHFLAISGSHMALIVALVVALVRRTASLSTTLLESFDVMRGAAVLGAVAVVAYAAVCGGGVSVWRSEMMALAAMAALWRGRPGDDLRALGGSAIVLALAMPGVGEEAGFQLSYLAVTALVMDARRRRAARREAAAPGAAVRGDEPASWSGQGLHLLLEAARLTLVCWVVTSPVVAHHFQRISLVAPLANLLAAPLVSAIVVSGIGGLVLLPVTPAGGDLAVRFGSFLSDLVVKVSVWCAALPMAATTTPALGAALTTAMTGFALVLLLPPWRWKRRAAVALFGVAALLVVQATHDRWRSDRLDVWFASVGQGDAAIVRMPGGKVWVIDEGPPGRGRMVVAPLLRRAWIGRVDVMVASHVQSDHAGALAEILEDFDVGEVWLPDGPCDVDAGRAIVRAAAERGVPVRRVSRAGVAGGGGSPAAAEPQAETPAGSEPVADAQGHEVPADAEPGVEVLWPPPNAAACNDNDQSLVMAVAFAGRRVLFTGDIEAAAEARVSVDADVSADVLKVPHHGSRTSSTEGFLASVAPGLAVASLGLDNQFRFPAPDVVARYAAHSIRLLRTDRHGAVHLTVDADGSIGVETFHPVAE